MSPQLRKAVDYGLIWVVLTLALLWPALFNGGPIWFADSFAYLNGPKSALAALFGNTSGGAFSEPDAIAAAVPEPYAGRSIYFGFVLYALTTFFGLWGGPVFQAGLFAMALIVLLRPFVVHRRRGTLFVGLSLAVFTAAPFYTSYLMPDYLAGLMILSAIRLLDVPAQAEKWERVVLWCVVALGALSHTGHVLMLISLVLLTPAIFRFSGLPFHWRMLRPLVAAIFVAGAGAAFFTAMVVETYGKPPLRPPFLSARVIADGPGYAHLVETCGEPRYALCAYVDRLPRSAAAILWNKDPETGIWGAAGPDTRRTISEQDLRFASDVLRTYPLDQVQASAHRFVEQLRWFGLEDFPYSLGLRQIIDTWWSGPEAGAIQSTRFYTGHFPIDAINMLYKLVVIASALHLVTLAIARNRSNAGGELPSSFGLFAVFVTVCIVLNAAIYGILSDPAPRYQGRVIWLFPMMSAIILWRDLLWENVMLGYRRRPPAE